jgi:hypothetical protein
MSLENVHGPAWQEYRNMSISNTDLESVESLIDDISNDNSDWTRHGMIQLLSLKNTFYKSIEALEQLIHTSDRILKRLLYVSAVLTGISMLLGFLILIIAEDLDSMVSFAIVLTIKIINVIVGFVGVLIASWMNIGSYRKDILEAQNAISEYHWLISSIELNLFKKPDQRCKMSTLIQFVSHSHNKLVSHQPALTHITGDMVNIRNEQRRMSNSARRNSIA